MANEDVISNFFQDPEIAKLVTKSADDIKQSLQRYIDRNNSNLGRVVTLVETADSLMDQASRNKGGTPDSAIHISNDVYGDILRAAVVFTHASLEDFLRTIAARLLPEAEEKVLDKIPLSDEKAKGHAEKFTLGRLAQHRGKSVDDVIRESVDQYLERSNFNDIGEIKTLLQSLGFDVDRSKDRYTDLSALIRRRHLIVHRADMSDLSGDGHLQDINPRDVIRWIKATLAFCNDITNQLGAKQALHAANEIASDIKKRTKEASK